ncbi:hypothetical protein DHEL01_v201763 [Diaporthe helianthi]|uniref:Uncharacterized protein n=1 Tax=Diaporthe helianthi TaxID=158607 RepID=A0A2P5IBJ9_DIAHE|nr:hypothetical protein DHEL01_v201763 [Diaporthe helianthi]
MPVQQYTGTASLRDGPSDAHVARFDGPLQVRFVLGRGSTSPVMMMLTRERMQMERPFRHRPVPYLERLYPPLQSWADRKTRYTAVTAMSNETTRRRHDDWEDASQGRTAAGEADTPEAHKRGLRLSVQAGGVLGRWPLDEAGGAHRLRWSTLLARHLNGQSSRMPSKSVNRCHATAFPSCCQSVTQVAD